MLIPLANAIFDDKLEIDDFLKPKLNNRKKFFFKNLNFINVDKKRFPLIKLKSRVNEYCSTPIIINAVNEILVDQFLKKKIPFLPRKIGILTSSTGSVIHDMLKVLNHRFAEIPVILYNRVVKII